MLEAVRIMASSQTSSLRNVKPVPSLDVLIVQSTMKQTRRDVINAMMVSMSILSFPLMIPLALKWNTLIAHQIASKRIL